MARIVITASADADTDFILRDLAQKAGVDVAVRYDTEFHELFRRLERFPESGAPRPALGRLVRIAVVSPYTIIHEYIEADDAVTIFRIVHGRRRLTRRALNRADASP